MKRKIPFGKEWDEGENSPLEWDEEEFSLWNGMEFPSPWGWKIQDLRRLRTDPGAAGMLLRRGEDPWEAFWGPWKIQELPWTAVGLIPRDPWMDPGFPGSSGNSAGKSISWNSEGMGGAGMSEPPGFRGNGREAAVVGVSRVCRDGTQS